MQSVRTHVALALEEQRVDVQVIQVAATAVAYCPFGDGPDSPCTAAPCQGLQPSIECKNIVYRYCQQFKDAPYSSSVSGCWQFLPPVLTSDSVSCPFIITTGVNNPCSDAQWMKKCAGDSDVGKEGCSDLFDRYCDNEGKGQDTMCLYVSPAPTASTNATRNASTNATGNASTNAKMIPVKENGSFRLVVAGCVTGDISVKASGEEVKVALEKLSNVVRVLVRATELNATTGIRSFFVTFVQIDKFHPGCTGWNDTLYNVSSGWNQAGVVIPPSSLVAGRRRSLLSHHGAASINHDPIFDHHHHDDQHDQHHGGHHGGHHDPEHAHNHGHGDDHDHNAHTTVARAGGGGGGGGSGGGGGGGGHHRCIHDSLDHKMRIMRADYEEGMEEGPAHTRGAHTESVVSRSMRSTVSPIVSSSYSRYRRLFFQEDTYTMWIQKEWKPIRIRLNTENVEMTDPVKFNFLTERLLPAAASYMSQALSVVPVKGKLRLSDGSCSGLGVPDLYKTVGVEADLVLFVSVEDTEEGVLAWSSPCYIDQCVTENSRGRVQRETR